MSPYSSGISIKIGRPWATGNGRRCRAFAPTRRTGLSHSARRDGGRELGGRQSQLPDLRQHSWDGRRGRYRHASRDRQWSARSGANSSSIWAVGATRRRGGMPRRVAGESQLGLAASCSLGGASSATTRSPSVSSTRSPGEGDIVRQARAEGLSGNDTHGAKTAPPRARRQGGDVGDAGDTRRRAD